MPVEFKNRNRIAATRLVALMALLFSGSAMVTGVRADTISVTGGTLSMTYDGSVFADVNNMQSWLPADPTEPDMVFGTWTPGNETVGPGPSYLPKSLFSYRPLPAASPGSIQPNYRDDRAQLTTEFPITSPTLSYEVNGNGTVDPSEGANQQSTNLTYDPSDPLGTMTGAIQTNGVTSWWFANDVAINLGFTWVAWGELVSSQSPGTAAAGRRNVRPP